MVSDGSKALAGGAGTFATGIVLVAVGILFGSLMAGLIPFPWQQHGQLNFSPVPSQSSPSPAPVPTFPVTGPSGPVVVPSIPFMPSPVTVITIVGQPQPEPHVRPHHHKHHHRHHVKPEHGCHGKECKRPSPRLPLTSP